MTAVQTKALPCRHQLRQLDERQLQHGQVVVSLWWEPSSHSVFVQLERAGVPVKRREVPARDAGCEFRAAVLEHR